MGKAALKVAEVEPARVDRLPELIALSKLALDPANVRKTALREDLAQLAEDIAAKGVLQNLIGRHGEGGAILITAGGRRLKALQLLRGKKRIDAEYLVPVVLLDDAAAGEASLSENLQRVMLNPADECGAFALLRDGGMDIETIAARFGLTVRHVTGRLRLAGLAPVVLEALRKGKITLDVAQAFGGVDDQAMQERVFKATNHFSADSVRRAMRNEGYLADHPRVRLVDRADYQARGGRIEGDLFTDDAAELWLDTAIVDALAIDALTVQAADWQARFGFARVGVTLDYSPDDVQTDGLTEADHNGNYNVDWTQYPEGGRSQLVVFLKPAHGTALVELCRQAWLASGTMLHSPEPVPPPRQSRETEDAGPDAEAGATDKEALTVAEPESPGLPNALIDALAMRRRDILAFELVSTDAGTAMAIDLAAFLLIEQSGRRFAQDDLGTSINVSDMREPVNGSPLPWADDDLAQSLADAWTSGSNATLDEMWRGEATVEARWAAFRELHADDRRDWLARGVAGTLRAYGNNMQRTPPALLTAVAGALDIDAATHWRPTMANYFDRVNKAACLAFLADVLGGDLAGWAKWKKSELASACEALAAGNAEKLGGLGDRDCAAVQAAGLAWLPKEITWGAVA